MFTWDDWKLSVAVTATVALFTFDRIFKTLVIFRPDDNYLVSGPLRIRFEANEGFAFGIPIPNTVVAIVMLIIAAALIVFFIRAVQQKDARRVVGTMMILTGALSNLIDRIMEGFVIDYIAVSILPIFNLADILILIGAIFLIFPLRRSTAS